LRVLIFATQFVFVWPVPTEESSKKRSPQFH
jgi:hypothetical protein